MAFGNFVTSGISVSELSNNMLVDIKNKDVKNAVNNLCEKIKSPLKSQIIKAFSIPQRKTNDVSQELITLIQKAFSGKDNLIEEIEQRQKHKFDEESIKDAISNHIRLMFENTQTALMLGKIEALNDSDCNKYEYKCSDNSSVCANCRALKDKVFDSENATIGVNFPPIHPYCRCDIIGINADGERVQFDDGGSYTPEILNEIRDLLTAFWKSTQNRTDKAFNKPNFYNISNYLTIGAFDAIRNMFLQNVIREEKALNNPFVYNVGNWFSSGLFDTINGAFMPEKPLSLQHWLDSFSIALMTMPVVQKAGLLIDNVENGVYEETINTTLQSFDDIVSNPTKLLGKSADEVAETLGEGWVRVTYGSKGTGWKFTKDDQSVFYHLGDGRHGGSYYGFSSGKLGQNKIVDSDYVALPGDKATIINSGE